MTRLVRILLVCTITLACAFSVCAQKPDDNYASLKRLYRALGQGSFCEETGPPRGRAVIRLKRRRMLLAGGSLGYDHGLFWGGSFHAYTRTTGPSPAASDVYSALSAPVDIAGAGRRWFIVDSGTSAVFITRRVAESLGLPPVAPAAYANPAFGWARNTWWVIIRELRVGGIEFTNVPAVVIGSDSGFHSEADGILPISLFRRHGVVLDQAARKLIVIPPRTPSARALGPGAFRLSSLWFGGEPFVRLGVQDGPHRFFLLDTGANGSLLGKKFVRGLGLAVDRAGSRSRVEGVVGQTYPDMVKDVFFTVGARRWKVPECYAAKLEQTWPIDCCGIIGRNILRHYRIYFDYPAGEVALQPVPKKR